ncbi:MAG TPA: c-type cytochrome [Solirubrobacteraceae bacterium]|jgi:mono/diheme cytochrome c family protein
MPPRLLAWVVAAACTAPAIAACGGSHGDVHATASGRRLFSQACGACHTLSGHNDPRHQGGDLLGFRATRPQMLQLAGEMPVRHPLSHTQLEAVVSFVMSARSR